DGRTFGSARNACRAFAAPTVSEKPLVARSHSASERGSDIGVLTFTALQLGLESAGVVAYLFGLFLYAIAAAVVLPIPVELLLLLYPEINPAVKAIALGLEKAVGAVVVFFVGKKANRYIERRMD